MRLSVKLLQNCWKKKLRSDSENLRRQGETELHDARTDVDPDRIIDSIWIGPPYSLG